MKIVKLNEMAFYRVFWYFGGTNELLKFDGELRDNSNAIHKWLEYGNS